MFLSIDTGTKATRTRGVSEDSAFASVSSLQSSESGSPTGNGPLSSVFQQTQQLIGTTTTYFNSKHSSVSMTQDHTAFKEGHPFPKKMKLKDESAAQR